MKGLLLMALLASGSLPAVAKSGPTYFTPARVATARANVERYAWAQRLQRKILTQGDPISYYIGAGKYTAADEFVALSDEAMWMLMPPTTIPRVYPHERRAVCPVHGTEVRQRSVWCPWRIDPIHHPYQVQCMLGGEWYPSNRFAAGDMTSGAFPDDGTGCVYQGERYYFLSEYIHMVYGSVVTPTLKSLSEAYQLTGDSRYARQGCILLARLAQQYPNYGWEGTSFADAGLEDRFQRTFLGPFANRHPHYHWKQGGFVTDLIWETFNLETQALAYDGLFAYMDQDDSLIAFLQDKGLPIRNGDDLRWYIETYLFRAAMKGLQDGWIHGNEGFHQAAALAVALVLDDYGDTHPNSTDMIEYAYHGLGHAAYVMVNGIGRDGGGHESPNYNAIKLDFIRVARLMEDVRQRQPERFPRSRYPDLFAAPQARSIFDYYIDIYVNDTMYPSIGDCGGIGAMTRRRPATYSPLTGEYLFAVERYGDPRYARACVDGSGEPLAGELWEPYPEAAIRAALADSSGRFERASRLLDGYGAAILESGDAQHKRSLVLNYTALRGHWQADPLTLGLFARGVDLTPDLGYPETWDYRWQYDSNSLAHNTVTIDETQPGRGIGNLCRLFAVEDGIHVVTASHQPYAHGLGEDALPNDVYERTAIMVDVDAERSYVVDCFIVNGGRQHDQSWHAFRCEPDMPEIGWHAQPGTLAGEEVERFASWTDKWGRQRDDFPSYLTHLRRAWLDQPAAWTWRTGLPEGDALTLHIIPVDGAVEIIRGDGRSPVREELPYLLIRRQMEAWQAKEHQTEGRQGEEQATEERTKKQAAERADSTPQNSLTSTAEDPRNSPTADSRPLHGAPFSSVFLTVLDPWQGTPTVTGVSLIRTQPLTLDVTRADGTERITLNLPPGPSATTHHRPVGVHVVSRTDGQITRDVRVGRVDDDSGYLTTRINAVHYDTQRIHLPLRPDHVEGFAPGRWIRIYNEERSALFRIMSARVEAEELVLHLAHTALYARGPVRKVATGRVDVDAHFTFATGQLENGELSGAAYAFAGAWLGEGDAAVQIAGATQDGTIILKDPVPARTLEQRFGDRVVSVWLYAPGDSVEVARVAGDLGGEGG